MDGIDGITNIGYATSESWSANGLPESSSAHNHQTVTSCSIDGSKSYARTFTGAGDSGDTGNENLSVSVEPGISQRLSLPVNSYSSRILRTNFSRVQTLPNLAHTSGHLCTSLNLQSHPFDEVSLYHNGIVPGLCASGNLNPERKKENNVLDKSNNSLSLSRFTKDRIMFWTLNYTRAKTLLKYILTNCLLIGGIWCFLYIIWEDYAFVDGSLFALLMLEILAIFLGFLADLLNLPPLIGMLTAGLILRNIPCINVAKNLSRTISSPLRGISVVILLTKGAFGINLANIKRFRSVVPSLAIGSCVIEAIFGSFSSYFILGFPPAWAALMGCILSAMSGFAVLPYLLKMEKTVLDNHSNNLQVKDTFVITKTACGMDAILAICMAKCCLGFVFGEGYLGKSILKGVGEVALGGLWGTIWGTSSGFLLKDAKHTDGKVIAILCGGIMSLLGLAKISYPRGGPLGVFLGCLIAVNVWRSGSEGPANVTYVSSAIDKLWFLFQPLLFGIIGSRTDFCDNVDWNIVWQGAVCLLISISSRVAATFLMTNFGDLPWRSRVFLAVSWLPKGTVQAALGPVALDTSLDLGLEPEFIERGNNVMNVAVTTIVLAGLFGSLCLKGFGLRILKVE